MKRSRILLGLFVAFQLSTAHHVSFAQDEPSNPDVVTQLIERLPADWRPLAIRYKVFKNSDTYLLKMSDGVLLSRVLDTLVHYTPSEDQFVAAHFDEVLASVPIDARDLIADTAYSGTPSLVVLQTLEHEAATNPDPQVRSFALKAWHAAEARRLLVLSGPRFEDISWDYKNNKEAVDALEEEQQNLINVESQVALPEFFLTPPHFFRRPVNTTRFE